MPETMSFIKSIFWDSYVKWSLPSLKAQPWPGSSLPFSFMASATLPTSSPISWTSFPFSGVRTGLQVGQAHSRQGPQQVQAGPAAARRASLLHGTIALHHAAVLINEKLGKVPFDGISQHAPALGLDFHPFPQWVGIVPIYTDLAVHVKLDVVAGCKLLDFLITSWLLPPKLVAGEGQDS